MINVLIAVKNFISEYRLFRPSDLVVYCFILLFLYSFYPYNSQNRGDTVVIEVNGNTVAFLSLERDTTVSMQGYKGEFTVSIKDKKVKMVDSDCPLKLCVKQGNINVVGEEIVCVPNRVRVYIKGESKIDGVSR